jgi:hypothetical protein
LCSKFSRIDLQTSIDLSEFSLEAAIQSQSHKRDLALTKSSKNFSGDIQARSAISGKGNKEGI